MGSVVNIHGVTSQYRWDKAMEANQLQKKQMNPSVSDPKSANKLTKHRVVASAVGAESSATSERPPSSGAAASGGCLRAAGWLGSAAP